MRFCQESAESCPWLAARASPSPRAAAQAIRGHGDEKQRAAEREARAKAAADNPQQGADLGNNLNLLQPSVYWPCDHCAILCLVK